MITGVVTPEREAVVRVKVQSLRGQEQAVQAVIDTGFTGLAEVQRTKLT